jgi:hypothetical protein
MPSAVTDIAKIAYKFDGAMIYTSNSDPRMYDATWKTFLPRAGFALRLNDKTSIRAGYARYAVPWIMVHAETGGLPTYGFSQSTSALGPLEGTPRTLLSDPFPASNPVVLPTGSSLGQYSQIGNSVSFWDRDMLKTATNDRLNFSVQRQVTPNLFFDATFFLHFGHDVQDGSMWGGSNSFNLNQTDPNLSYQYKGLLDASVANPFYGMPASVVPGSLRTQQTVSVGSLLKTYPQYGDLNVLGWPGGTDHYYGLALKAERHMANGLAFTVGYNYNQEFHSQYFNAEDAYTNRYTMWDRGMARHNLTVSGTWQLPVGRGKAFLGNANRFLDALVGGWATSNIFTAHSGSLLMFNQANVSGDPRQNVPAGDYFNPAVFSVPDSYTPRTNPLYYDGLRGPSFFELDSTAVKYFHITERMKLEIRFEMFNTLNQFLPSNPDTGIGSGTMGQSTWIADGNYGRAIQYSAKIHF